jgi:hypothetical protein
VTAMLDVLLLLLTAVAFFAAYGAALLLERL